jgi:hypothetical protein
MATMDGLVTFNVIVIIIIIILVVVVVVVVVVEERINRGTLCCIDSVYLILRIGFIRIHRI